MDDKETKQEEGTELDRMAERIQGLFQGVSTELKTWIELEQKNEREIISQGWLKIWEDLSEGGTEEERRYMSRLLDFSRKMLEVRGAKPEEVLGWDNPQPPLTAEEKEKHEAKKARVEANYLK